MRLRPGGELTTGNEHWGGALRGKGREAMGGGHCDGVGQLLQPSGINVVTMTDDLSILWYLRFIYLGGK